MKTRKGKKTSKLYSKNLLVITIGAALLISVVVVGVSRMGKYEKAADQADLIGIREAILLSNTGLQSSAPVDPKTGDIYFPEAKLFVPNDPANGFHHLTYTYEKEDNRTSVSSRQLYTRHASKLYISTDFEGMMAYVPTFQACMRGVVLVDNKIDGQEGEVTLQKTVNLNNGKKLYLYTENACPDLSEIVTRLESIQSY
jgi:hypothetical protein